MYGVLGVTAVTGEELNRGHDAPRDAGRDGLGRSRTITVAMTAAQSNQSVVPPH